MAKWNKSARHPDAERRATLGVGVGLKGCSGVGLGVNHRADHDSESGSSMISTSLSVVMFVTTVTFSAHILVTQYGRFAARAILRDAVHDVAATGIGEAETETPSELFDVEARMRQQLGAVGASWTFTWEHDESTWTLVGTGQIAGLFGQPTMRYRTQAVAEPYGESLQSLQPVELVELVERSS